MPISIRTTMKKSEEDMDQEDLNLSLQLGGCRRNKRKREKFSEKGVIIDDHGGDDENQIVKEKSFEEPLLMQLSLPSVISGRKNKQKESSEEPYTWSMIRENSKAKPALFAACQQSTTSSEQEKQPAGNNRTEDQANIAESQYAATVSDTAAMNEDENGHAKKKLRLSKEQAFLLEENFRKHATLNPTLKVTLAKELSLQPRQVEVWFQNRRARTKLKQTEIDCKFLKHRYHMLSLENCRLKREVAELRAFRTTYASAAHPLHKHIPMAGGLPFCHSCLHSTAFLSDTSTTGALSTRKPNTFASLLLKPQF